MDQGEILPLIYGENKKEHTIAINADTTKLYYPGYNPGLFYI